MDTAVTRADIKAGFISRLNAPVLKNNAQLYVRMYYIRIIQTSKYNLGENSHNGARGRNLTVLVMVIVEGEKSIEDDLSRYGQWYS